ncbi:hypothetical protein ACFU6I_40055 [Streptomyces sp. NPDC057486]|uniref:hypothetical protein n=1 Tax=Streptomyces sp. NPDC057486 TaxID=3346145 RepID=UPI003694D797
MLLPDKPIDDRYLTQDDRITIAEGLLARHTLRDLIQVERQLNQRPRRILGDRTPAEAMRRWSRELAYR